MYLATYPSAPSNVLQHRSQSASPLATLIFVSKMTMYTSCGVLLLSSLSESKAATNIRRAATIVLIISTLIYAIGEAIEKNRPQEACSKGFTPRCQRAITNTVVDSTTAAAKTLPVCLKGNLIACMQATQSTP